MYNILTKKLSETILTAKTFAIITHKRPDGDAISSALAMFWYLLDVGKMSSEIDVIIPEFNNDFSFIPGIEYLKKSPTKETYDVLIIVDCANLSLLEGSNILNHAKQIISFDHHEQSSIDSSFGIIDTTAPSCTCIIHEIFTCMSKPFLNCIVSGLISDTNNLSLNAGIRGQNIINALQGEVDINYITAKLSSQNSRTMELVRLVQERGKLFNESIFCSYLFQKDLLDTEKNLTQVNHKGIIVELQKNVKYTSLVLLIENDKHEFRGSIRTFDSNIDLNEICSRLVSEGKLIKGGGHSYSAGFTANGSPDSIFSFFVSKF